MNLPASFLATIAIAAIRHPPFAQCQSKRIKFFGSGTERVEDLVQQVVPQSKLLRWDADTTSHKGSHADILDRFARHEADILIGTQMIAKGLDLPLVTLVGVIAADIGLYCPIFALRNGHLVCSPR